MWRYHAGPIVAVLIAGILLRLATWWVTHPCLTNDNHFDPVRIILEKGRLPRADDCWSCYHPPLYYLASALAYKTANTSADWFRVDPTLAHLAGLKTIQFVSCLAGCLTLLVCAKILASVPGLARWQQVAGLAAAALLPRHIQMSAMATNDALAYLLASLAIAQAIRVAGPSGQWKPALAAGCFAGLCVLTKAYGLATAFCVIGWVVFNACRRSSGPMVVPKILLRNRLTPVVAALAGTVLFGIWPTVRNYSFHGRPHVDNFKVFPPMSDSQLPGSLAEVDFTSFRYLKLLEHPWIHTSTLNSFWTVLFAQYWFDAQGTQNTLLLYPDWRKFREEVSKSASTMGPRERNRRIRDYDASVVSPNFARVARAAYLMGLPLLIFGAAGLLRSAGRTWSQPAFGLLIAHFLLCMLMPVFQTLRQPVIGAMKAEFTLSCLSSLSVFIAVAVPLATRRRQIAAAVVGGILSIGLLFVNIGYAIEEARLVNLSPPTPWRPLSPR